MAARASRPTSSKTAPPSEPESRSPLPVPQGLLEDAPETLDAWLNHGRAHLLVDGYNVSKHEAGYGDLSLEAQRGRLVDEVTRLVRAKKVDAIIVFDGANMPPGTSRRARGPVKVEYSKPPESGDDHLVGRLGTLPNFPVIVVTDDRELRERASALGATLAFSTQLLALIRP
jgi:predicted RNA-binding protein with PIN domain